MAYRVHSMLREYKGLEGIYETASELECKIEYLRYHNVIESGSNKRYSLEILFVMNQWTNWSVQKTWLCPKCYYYERNLDLTDLVCRRCMQHYRAPWMNIIPDYNNKLIYKSEPEERFIYTPVGCVEIIEV